MKSDTMTTVTQNVIFVPLGKTFDNRDQAGVIDQEKVLEIAESLKHNRDNGLKGLHQVPLARGIADGYEMAFGRHRRAAFQYLAQTDPFWNEIPLIVREMDDLGMFEALADENFKRRDLNFVEAAEIIRAYVTKYGKTYVEAAAFFGKTEEYIRSTARFVSLPETAKNAARHGEMNVTTARLVLSAQKVLGKDDLETVIEDLVENANGIHDTPQECIQSALEGNAIRFDNANSPWWNEQKFPIKHLAPVQRKDMADLLDVESNADQERKSMLNQIMTLIASGMEITDGQFPAFTHEQLENVRTLVNPPVCTNCAIFAQIDSAKYCGMKACFDRKALAWKRSEMDRVSKKVGIPLYDNDADGGKYVALGQYNADDKKLFEARHADLRLLPTKGNETIWNNFTGLPTNLKLVAVGKTAEKRMKGEEKKDEARQATRADYEREQEKARFQMQVRDLKNEFTMSFTYHVIAPAFESLLDFTSLPFSLWFFSDILDSSYGEIALMDVPQGVDGYREQMEQIQDALKSQKATPKKKAEALKQLRHLFAFQIAAWRMNRSAEKFITAKKPLIALSKVAEETAAEWSVKLPKNFAQEAEKYQADFEQEVKELEKENA